MTVLQETYLYRLQSMHENQIQKPLRQKLKDKQAKDMRLKWEEQLQFLKAKTVTSYERYDYYDYATCVFAYYDI
jgi:hypothetical protein